jgi:hypothetical protein
MTKKTVKAKKLGLGKATLHDQLDNHALRTVFHGALLLVIASVMPAGCVDLSEPGSATDGAEGIITDATVAGEASSLTSPGAVFTSGDPFLVKTTSLIDVAASTSGALTHVTAGALTTVPQQNITSLNYTTYLGFGGNDRGESIAIDGSGNAYITGTTSSFGSTTNVFVAKMSPSGSLLYYVYFPGSTSQDISVDGAGYAYVVGTTAAGEALTKINPTGTGIVYSAVIGWSWLAAVQVDAGGNVYLAGQINTDVAVGKLNPAGTAFIYAVSFGGTGLESSTEIAVDTAGSAYIVGFTTSSNFPAVNAFQPSLRGGEPDAFVTKLNATGTGIVFSTYLGGDLTDVGLSIAVDRNNNSYVTGTTSGAGFPVSPGSAQSTPGGMRDAFVTKFSSMGIRLYSTYVGGSGQEAEAYIAVTPAGAAYLVGHTSSTNFPTTASAFQPLAPGASNAFVVQLNTTGSAYSYSTYLGGSDNELGSSIAVNSSGRAYATGTTYSTNFPTTVSGHGGLGDAFVTSFNGP